MPLTAPAILVPLAAVLALAGEPLGAADPAALCEAAAERAARESGVPAPVLHAIALVETGRREGGRVRPWPWAANREGRGHWFTSEAELLAFARASLAAGRRSVDLGCFQINVHWHGHNFPAIEAMTDPESGARYAASFLADLYAELGSWPAAAAAYHSRTPEHAEPYRARFERILASLGGAPAPAVAAARPPAPQRRVRGPLIITLDAGGAPSRLLTDPPEDVVEDDPFVAASGSVVEDAETMD